MRLIKSFRQAISGLKWAVKEEKNFRIQLIIGLIVLFLAVFLRVEIWQFIILVLVVVLVLVLELINTTFEKMVDILKPRVHQYAYLIKNLMAAAVFLASIGAIIIGLLILGPYLLSIF